MSLKSTLKSIAENIPYSLGSKLAYIPFSVRLGRDYTIYRKQIQSHQDSFTYAIKHFSAIFEHAKEKYPFYQKLYKKAGVYHLKIQSVKDIQQLPIITKQDIRNHTDQFRGAMRINTGGTSGEPFSFYIDKNAFAREWAHMHAIWEKRGYKYTDLKITLRGKDLGSKAFQYNPVHNEFIVNTYLPAASIKDEILNLFSTHTIKYLHGYPSAVYNFLSELSSVISTEEKMLLKKNLKACLLGSEFPLPYITDYIYQTWGLDYISWYGHSEMCILAYDEFKRNEYKVFPTYGLAEVADGRLIGTSFHNFDMPLIRYDTGDLIEANYSDEGLIESFRVTQGRNGDYIVDKKGKHIPLTALIFGRHHEVFNYARFIQVEQVEAGNVVFHITSDEHNSQKILNDLNMKNIDVNYSIQIHHEPIRTKSGKVSLKIQSQKQR